MPHTILSVCEERGFIPTHKILHNGKHYGYADCEQTREHLGDVYYRCMFYKPSEAEMIDNWVKLLNLPTIEVIKSKMWAEQYRVIDRKHFDNWLKDCICKLTWKRAKSFDFQEI